MPEIFKMFFLKHLISVVTSSLDEEDLIELLRMGLGFSSLLQPVISIIQKLIMMRHEIKDLRKSYKKREKTQYGFL